MRSPRGWTVSQPHHQCGSILGAPLPCQHWAWTLFSTSLAVQRYLVLVLICISLVANDIKYLSTLFIFFAINKCSLCTVLFKSFAYFKIGLFIFLLIYIVYKSFIGYVTSKYFHPVSSLNFCVFCKAKNFSCDEVQFISFPSTDWVFGLIAKNT